MTARRGVISALLAAALVAITSAPGPAAADGPLVLRIATVAPDRSSWAREFSAFVREAERGTAGRVKIKVYFGGVAGDEIEVGRRIARGQLDGALSGNMLCNRIMPSMRVLRLSGVFQSRAEASHVINRLLPQLKAEAARAGFTLLLTTGLGGSLIFSRRPLRTMADLRAIKLWRWEFDDIVLRMNRHMGIQVIGLPLADAGKAYDDRRTDGFYSIPGAALAFQWYTRTPFVLPIKGDYLTGCFLIANRAFDAIAPADQVVLHEAATKAGHRFDEVGRRQDDALLTKVFPGHGLVVLPVSRELRAQYFAAARAARAGLGDQVAPELIDRVMEMLADYRAEHQR